MRWIVRIPVICVGVFLLFYLFFLIPGTGGIYTRIIDTINPGEPIPESIDYIIENDPPGQIVNSEFKLITPPNQAVVKSGNISLVCRKFGNNPQPPTLYFDDIHTEWSYEPSDKIWIANVYLWPGVHKLKLGKNDLKICAVKTDKDSDRLLTDPGVPISWVPSYIHPDSNQWDKCFDCHKVPRDPRFANIGPFDMSVDCNSCHLKLEMTQRHGEITSKPINDCTSCHSIHSSTRHSLLSAPIDELLKEQ